MVKYSKSRKSKRRYNKSKRRYNKTKRRYNKTKRRYSKKRYSKKNQHGGMNRVRSVRRHLTKSIADISPEPEIIVREHFYTDLTPPLIRNALNTLVLQREELDPILPYKFKTMSRRGDVGVLPIYTRERGFKMYVIGVEYSPDGGRTYNKIVINQANGMQLLENNVPSLYFGPDMPIWPPHLTGHRLLKIFFIRGFFPLYTELIINKDKLAMMIKIFYQSSDMEGLGLSASMAKQFFFNVPPNVGDYGDELEPAMRSLISNNQRHLRSPNFYGLSDVTLIPVAIDHRLIIDENPDRQKLTDILTRDPHFSLQRPEQEIRLGFLHSPHHLPVPSRRPPAPARPLPDSSEYTE